MVPQPLYRSRPGAAASLVLAGEILVGVLVVLAGWWLMDVARTVWAYSFSAVPFPLVGYPIAPRLLVAAIALLTTLVLFASRTAAITAAVVCVVVSVLSWLGLLADIVQPLLELRTSTPPGQGLWSADPVVASLRDLGYAMLQGPWTSATLLLSGAWVAIAVAWLLPVRSASAPEVPRSRATIVAVIAGIVVLLAGWWLVPIVDRAILRQFIDRPGGFTAAASLVALAAAALLTLVLLRSRTAAFCASALGIVLLLFSVVAVQLADAVPIQSLSPTHGTDETWRLSLADLGGGIVSSAYSLGTIALSGAFMGVGLGWLVRRGKQKAH
jgi:hypothetical protein